MKDFYFHIYKSNSLLHQIPPVFLSNFFAVNFTKEKKINFTKWGEKGFCGKLEERKEKEKKSSFQIWKNK